MNNWEQDISGNPIQLEIYISSKDSTTGFLEIPQNPAFPIQEFVIIPDVATQISIPTSIAMAEGFGNIESKGIHIHTEGKVSVYAMNKRQYSADISVILPTISLGKNYLVTAHWEEGNRNNGDNSDSEFLVVAIADNTTVEIIPSVNAQGGKTAGVPFRVELHRGDVYEVQARGDLTGTQVYAVSEDGNCSTFALFAGNRYTKVGECDHPDGHDHLYAQMYPTNTWGLEYITIPFKTRVGGDYFKVMAAEDNTTIQFNETTHVLDRGEHIRETLSNVNIISADKPINVSQFSRSQACDNSTSDPFTLIVSPKEQLLREVTFYAPPGNNLNAYYLNVLIPKEDVFTITLDGTFISQSFDFVPGDGDYMYAQIPITEGNHTLKSNTGFNAYVYGYGFNESFGFATGASLENLSLEISVRDNEGFTLSEDDICWTTTVNFQPVTAIFFNQYSWDFGDGSTASSSEAVSQTHTYSEPGTYIIQLAAQRFEAACAVGGEEISLKKIEVTRPSTQILGPRSVCPNTPGVEYKAISDPVSTFQWDLLGGSIASSIDDSLTVDWGSTNTESFVGVIPTTAKGCVGLKEILPVTINVKLDPEAPFGPDSLCSIDIEQIDYYTYETTGSQFEWGISGGGIESGTGSANIIVDWDGPGNKKLWFYQTSSLDSICGGGSDTLDVFVERRASADGLLNVPEFVIVTDTFLMELLIDTLYTLANWEIEHESFKDTIPIQSLKYAFNCPGTYEISAIVYDTIGVCRIPAKFSAKINARRPELDILHVTNEPGIDSTLFLRWKSSDLEKYNKSIDIRGSSSGAWVSATVMGEGNEKMYQPLKTHSDTHSYRFVYGEDCPVPAETNEHTSILSQVDQSNGDVATIYWNEYQGWSEGVDHYEVWLTIDENDPVKISEIEDTNYQIQDSGIGFNYCISVKAIEYGGNRSYSWSNEACAQFIPQLTPFNVFSPNGDQYNQTFEITGIEHYPNSVLTIFNRYGKEVFKTTGYQNTWNGGNLQAGVYFWGLELNEPKIELERMNGQVSILK